MLSHIENISSKVVNTLKTKHQYFDLKDYVLKFFEKFTM